MKQHGYWHTTNQLPAIGFNIRLTKILSGLLVDQPLTSSNTTVFPQTTAQNWRVTFSYSQPLRIAEIGLDLSPGSTVEQATLRFLAQPNKSYRIFSDPAYFVDTNRTESVLFNNISNQTTRTLPPAQQSPFFQERDWDGDGVLDTNDNCQYHPNPTQQDENSNSKGDACEDFDGDNVVNSEDNCPDEPNRNQQDTDADGIGDQCDPDESRLTEKYAWLPWTGIVLGFGIVLGLLKITMRENTKL